MADAPKPTELTARLVAQPSKIIKGIPPFVFSAPSGWVIDEAPSALAVVRTPREIEGFWVNAIISHDRVSRQVDYKMAAQVTWQKLQRDSPDAKERFERMVRFGANIVFLRGADLLAPKTQRPLSQLHALFSPVDGGGKVVDFFQIICTAPGNLMDKAGPDFMEIIGSFRFM